MYKIDFHHPCHIYFIGIGGISMSGLAEVLLEEGFRVSGSDIKPSPLTESLEKNKASVFYGQKASNLADDIDVVVYTSAIHEDNPEFIAMKERELPSLTRAELLGQMMQNYDIPIAVSGTHGKTTTTSMISEILLEGDYDPTLSIGGILKAIGGNIRVGKSEYFVTEACEYTNSFLSFFPIISSDIENYKEITDGLQCRIVTYGASPDSDYSCSDIRYDALAHPTFLLNRKNGRSESFSLMVPGEHNVHNAMAAIALADLLGIGSGTVQKAFSGFSGTDRRYEYKGERNGITIIDDYAHHPTEITATLKAASNYPHKSLWCVFQPHTYTRTKAFLSEFAKALRLADHVVLADIYAARETDTFGISSKDLRDEILRQGGQCTYLPSFSSIENFILENCINGDLLITMGAGDVVKIGENLLRS